MEINSDKKIKRITVELKSWTCVQETNKLAEMMEGRVIRTFKYFPYVVIEVPEGNIQLLSQNEKVITFFEDGEVFALEQQLPWGVDHIDAELVQSNYGIKGYGVRVAVIDTGIDLNHPDLNVYGGKSFISASYQDDNGHGTHVAGTIAALDNNEGVIGVAPESEIYALKVLNSSGSGYWSDVAAAIEWSIDNTIDIINMSLGGGSSDSLLKVAVTKAYQEGILLVAAAGNSGNSSGTGDNVLYPAKFPEAIAVAATDSNNNRGAFSSTGPDVELAAPGVNVFSTYLGATYKSLNGTSMAAPHVAGLAALIKSAYPSWTNEEIRSRLTQTAIDLGTEGRDSHYGYGLIYAPAAVEESGPDTSPPQIFFKNLTPGETVSGKVKIEIVAYDVSGVTNLKLSIDGVLVQEWSSSPYIHYWDASEVTVGPHDLTVEATDGAGNVGEQQLQVIVGATVTLFMPRDGFVISKDVNIKAYFSDNAVVTKADLYINEALKDSKIPSNNQVDFVWDSREVKLPGVSNWVIKVVALTDEQIETSNRVTVIKRNPVVKVVQPPNNTSVSGDGVTVTAHITDDNNIEKAVFLVDNNIVDTAAFKPYETYIDANNVLVGNHVVKTVAYIDNGQTAESQEIIIKKPTRVNFVSPLNGSIVKGTNNNITVQFSDSVGMAELYLNNTLVGNKTVNGMGPVTWNMDTLGYENLSVVAIKINAYTSKDQVLSSSMIHVTVDNHVNSTPPAVRILSPQTGYVIEQPVAELLAEAVDDVGIDFVEFYLDDNLLEKVFNAPYSINYDFSSVLAGKYYLKARAVDLSGNIGESEPIEIFKPAFIQITSPSADAIVTGVFAEFEFTCSDAIMGPVNLYVDDNLYHTMYLDSPTTGIVSIPYLWDTTVYPDFTQHSITIEVFTAKDEVIAKDVIIVTVDNSVDVIPPQVNLTASKSGTVQGTVLFTAEATDNKEIERVEFYINEELAEDQVFPFDYIWDASKVKTGEYSFSAKAYDTSGNSGLSNLINLSVPTKVSVISPISNTHVVENFNDFSATFEDLIAGTVKLYIDNEFKVDIDTGGPTRGPVQISYNWDIGDYPIMSQHEIMITAETAEGKIPSWGRINVYVDKRTDANQPGVRLISSAYRVIEGDRVILSAIASDDTGIKRVEFYKEDSLVATAFKEPYEFEWSSTGQQVGSYSYYAKAYDYAGNVTKSNQVMIGLAATVSIISPYENQVVSGVIDNFDAEFSAPVHGYVYLYIGGILRASKRVEQSGKFITIENMWNTSEYENGSIHEIKIRAYSSVGSVRSEGTVTVTVQN